MFLAKHCMMDEETETHTSVDSYCKYTINISSNWNIFQTTIYYNDHFIFIYMIAMYFKWISIGKIGYI